MQNAIILDLSKDRYVSVHTSRNALHTAYGTAGKTTKTVSALFRRR